MNRLDGIVAMRRLFDVMAAAAISPRCTFKTCACTERCASFDHASTVEVRS